MKNENFKKYVAVKHADIFTEIFAEIFAGNTKTYMQKDLHWNFRFANNVELR